MVGSFVVDSSLWGPTAMLAEVPNGLAVAIREPGLPMTSGALALCLFRHATGFVAVAFIAVALSIILSTWWPGLSD